MTKRTVKAELIKRGISQKQIADELHVSPAAVSMVVNGRANSHRIKKFIAEKLGKKCEKLWGKTGRA